MMKSVVVLSVLLIALFMVPVVSQAQDGFGAVISLPVLTAPSGAGAITDNLVVTRTFLPGISLAMNLRIFDSNGLLQGTVPFVAPAGAVAGKIVVFLASAAISSVPLSPSNNFTGTLFTTPLTIVGLTQYMITNLANAVQMIGTGRGGIPGPPIFGYSGTQAALAIIPETGTGIKHVFYCDILDNNKAAQYGIGPVPPGTLHNSFLIDATGGVVATQTFAHQAFLVAFGTAINAAVASGGSMALTFNPGGARLAECVHGTRISNAVEFGYFTIP